MLDIGMETLILSAVLGCKISTADPVLSQSVVCNLPALRHSAKLTKLKSTHKIKQVDAIVSHAAGQETHFLTNHSPFISNYLWNKQLWRADIFSQGKSLLEQGKEMSHTFQPVCWFESSFAVECTRSQNKDIKVILSFLKGDIIKLLI